MVICDIDILSDDFNITTRTWHGLGPHDLPHSSHYARTLTVIPSMWLYPDCDVINCYDVLLLFLSSWF